MTGAIQPAAAVLPSMTASKPSRIGDAATQFESLLIGEMLRSARESSADDGDESNIEKQTMLDVADQQFAQVLAKNGGIGIAKVIVQGLNKESK
jgi:Rod binding domain-containing protein